MLHKSDLIRTPLGDTGFDSPGALFDQRRTRTAWFEGQHVTADQFNRDQSYHLTRQSDLGRTIGQGVVEGFEVSQQDGNATGLAVSAGLGLAPSGEVIHLPQSADLDLADIPTQRRLNALLEARGGPNLPPETRTGLFVLAVSTVEYPSHPVGSYPVSTTATRTLEDSIINEAALFTLTPYPAPISNAATDTWQRAAAYRIFVEAKDPELPAAALPLAMVALSGNRIVWVDTAMVRRSCAPASGDIFGLGLVDQARRVAHFEQFDGVIAPRLAGNAGTGLAAASVVDALPPMGRLPVSSITMRSVGDVPARLSQNWLPASVPCELVALPEDEIEALLRESVHLPPIDLGAEDAVLANTPVTIIVPVPRADWMRTPGEVLQSALPLVPPPAVGGAPTDPAALLDELINGAPAPTPSDSALSAQWRALLGQADELWYARRRQFARSDTTLSGIVDETIPRPVETDGPIEVTPTEPVVITRNIGVDPEPLIAMLRPGLATLHDLLGLSLEFDKLLDGEPDLVLPLLVRQQQAVSAEALTLIGASTVAVVQRGADLAQQTALLSPSTYEMYAKIEPAILGQGLNVILEPSRTSNIDAIQDLVAKNSRLGAVTSGNALRSHAPLAVRSVDLMDPDRLKQMMETALEAKIPLSFKTYPAFDGKVKEARAVLMLGKDIFKLAQIVQRVSRAKWVEMVPALRDGFGDGGAGDATIDKLIDTARGFG